jgi:hypothetical protein
VVYDDGTRGTFRVPSGKINETVLLRIPKGVDVLNTTYRRMFCMVVILKPDAHTMSFEIQQFKKLKLNCFCILVTVIKDTVRINHTFVTFQLNLNN